MSPSEAIQNIRQIVTQHGEQCEADSSHTLNDSITIPKLYPHGAGSYCSAVNMEHTVVANDDYTKFNISTDYDITTLYLQGRVTHIAHLQVNTADHAQLDRHLEDRSYRANNETLLYEELREVEQAPFPGLLDRWTELPKTSKLIDRMPYVDTGARQLFIAGLVLNAISHKYPPARLLSVGNHTSLPNGWLNKFASWLDQNKTAE